MSLSMNFKKFFILVLCAVPVQVYALPFNDDMVDSQIKTGQVMRPKVDGTVALGSLEDFSESKEAATQFENPRSEDFLSITNGRRLYEANCYACHGNVAPRLEEYKPGPVLQFGMPAPNLGHEIYHRAENPSLGKTDGYFFATVRYGGLAIMPALGYKLSANEIWDVINYVRSVQEQ